MNKTGKLSSNVKYGRLICLEGIEGAGKTTHASFISDYLRTAHQPVLVTREPGGTPIAEAIRNIILNPAQSTELLTNEAELLLLFAARAQHIAHVIKPALAEGRWVICDRFTEASYAYQGGGRGLPESFIENLQVGVQQTLAIDRVLLLDLPVLQAQERVQQRSNNAHTVRDRIESETELFFTRVRTAYLKRAKQHSELYRVIDASAPLSTVSEHIKHVLDELLNCNESSCSTQA